VRLHAPLYNVPIGPFGTVCSSTAASALTSGTEETEWTAIRDLAREYGFPIY
jgi:hypothetical protein